MYRFCTDALHFSEASAFHRIGVARAARAYPLLLERIREGALHLAGAKLLAPQLTPENHVKLLHVAAHKTKRAIEELLADRAPKPDVPARVRQLPEIRPALAARLPIEIQEPPLEATSFEAPTRTPVPRPPSPAPSPLGAKRFKIQFTGDQALRDKLREAQSLLRHQIPDGDLAKIFDRALSKLIENARRKKFAHTSSPRTRSTTSGTASRHIPAGVKRAVVARDGGRCVFVASNGRRCGSRDFLEFHHRDPWAKSKRHSTDRIELRCRGHNHYAALQEYGAEHMARFAGRDHWSRGQSKKQRE